MAGYKFRLLAKDGDDLGVREFAMSNWSPDDTVALRDKVFVVYLADDGDMRAMLMLEDTFA